MPTFSRPVTVRFDEADPRGIMFFGRAFEIAHRVFEEFVTAGLGIPWDRWFVDDRIFIPVRHAEAEFRRPLRAGRTYRAEFRVAVVGDSSFEVRTRFIDPESGTADPCIETRVTHVFADAATSRKIPIPAELRAKLVAHLDRE